jgi:ribosomal protein RSM22 (predicted rRNA methylase)
LVAQYKNYIEEYLKENEDKEREKDNWAKENYNKEDFFLDFDSQHNFKYYMTRNNLETILIRMKIY